ncbi:uncharacterized protein LOC113209152 isoform X2 [Frankliniella occidentalis]|uniref:Uncharacterized protein LOC113209152 isoform X2 n=1 Tax=Frankliniella occidentalis TaxID=133901 RepID=A0A9C6UBS5_FRAOC|nr:uncharacterized protein LOC113209152 isoform X2 [Frankliniella occidentalis]
MLVYGGYRDLRGSSNELWAFHFDTESWHIISSGKTVSKSDSIPPARHKHSAVIHEDTMWVYGGMTDLNERQDLWRIDLHRKRWQCVRGKQVKQGPGPLHSHAACKLPGCMLVFGGERAGQPCADLWRFHFGTETWDRVVVEGPKPSARAEAVALSVSELLLTAAAASSLSSPEASSAASPAAREARSPQQDPQELRRVRAGGSVDRQSDRRMALHNRVSPQQAPQEKKRNGLPNGPQASTPQNGSSNLGFLKEISKLSQINLSRLAHHKCNYSVLDADAGESTVDEDGQDQDGPSPQAGPRSAPPHSQQPGAKPVSKLVKSQSVNLISRRQRPTLSSIPRRKPLPRDNASVPNFTTLASSLPTPVLTPVEAARLVFLDSDEPEDDEELSPRGEYIRPASPGGPVGPGTPVGGVLGGIPSSASRDFSLLHQQFTPKRRSESYTSHLGHAAELQQRQLQEEQELMRQQQLQQEQLQQKHGRTIPKSASVRFQPHLEEVSDENISSTSDYASIETVNRLSSASNYSVSNRPSPVDSGKSSSRPSSGRKTPIKEGPISFCNPNYVGPEAARRRQQQQAQAAVRKSWHAGMAPPGLGSPSGASTPQQAAARLLNSPPDSLLEDPHGRSSSRCFREDRDEDVVELQQMGSIGSPPKRAPPQSLALRNTAHPACNHHHHHHHHNNHVARGANKSRASSASRAERGHARTDLGGGNDQGDGAPARPQPAAVYMFVVGGKEHGQVTVFRRPLSVWKLLLHHYAF